MKKTKTTCNPLQRCSLLLLPIILATVLLPLFPPQKAYSAIPRDGGGSVTPEHEAELKASDYCSPKFSTYLKECVTGYKKSLLAQAVAKDDFCGKEFSGNSIKEGLTGGNNKRNACKNGFDEGWREFKKDNPARVSKTEAETRAASWCATFKTQAGVSGPPVTVACQDAYVAALQTEEVDFKKACSAFKDGSDLNKVCVARFKDGLRAFQKDHDIKNPATPSNGNTQGADPGAGEDTTPKETADCESATGSGLSWILCLLIEGASEANDTIFSIIQPLLKNVPVGNSPEDSGYIAWQSFRVLGNVFLVGCLLAIVFAQVRTPK